VIDQVHASAPSSRHPDSEAATPGRTGQTQTVLGLMLAVAIADQTTKYWAWRHAARAVINAGSTWPLGRPVSAWYSGSLTGPLMDVVSCGLLSLAVIALVRRRRPAVVLVSGALAIAGWSSNLLDRLATHRVNAPGSPRGAIDFLPLGGHFYNIADVVILGSTVIFLAAVCALNRPGGHARGTVPAVPTGRIAVGTVAADRPVAVSG
jgi:lipoprotein signal peptidase